MISYKGGWRVLHKGGLGIAFAVALTAVAIPAAYSATFVVINDDGAGEGFNDPTPVAPVGGNPGKTIGEQRLIAFRYAANLWGARLSSRVKIRVLARFDPQSCNATSTMLGSAGPIGINRDFTNAPVANTWYPDALANALIGADADPDQDDIDATFNSALGTTCAFPGGWYYGFDGNATGNDVDFISVLLHELGHGLGFTTFVDDASGAKLLGLNDTYMLNLENHGASPPDYPSMTDSQRVAASTATGNLHWVGPNVMAASGALTAGTVGTHVRMYAPNPQEPGSTVAHFDTVLTPNQVMEPSYTDPIHNPVMELPLFKDIGWRLLAAPAHDFGFDGRGDILFKHTNGTLAVWEMNRNVASPKGNIGSLPAGWQVAGTGDVDGDRKADLILRRSSDGQISVWEMDGLTVKAKLNIRKASTIYQIAGIGDVDGDGKADIILRRNDGLVVVWELNGNLVKAALNIGPADNAWHIQGIGDVNGDGKADIIWRHNDGRVVVWVLDGNHIKAALNVETVVAQWQIAGIGDVNADGNADIIWRHLDGRVLVWEMNGGFIKEMITVGTAPKTWKIVSVGDYDGDGNSDLLFRAPNGNLAIWELQGGRLKAKLGAGNLASAWTVVQ
jgi:hypothetical protein